jgi:crotonobetaine/carnitine-CoA ligase
LAGASTTAPDVAPAGPDDIGALFFTSGTTGPSKAVATTWPYLFRAAETVASAWAFGAGDVLWTAMPLFHLSAAPTVLAPMLVGGTSVLADGFHPARVWDEIRVRRRRFRRGGCHCRCCGICRRIRAMPIPLQFVSAAPISELYRDIERRYGCRIVTMYGLTGC